MGRFVGAGSAQRGFSLAEMLVVVALIAVGTAIAIPVTMASVQRAKGDSALSVTEAFLDGARDRAVAERRNIELSFQAPNILRLHRVEVPSGLKTVVGELRLEAGQELLKFAGVPDTPDAFGNASVFEFSGTAPFMFTSDGSLIDSAGDVSNGTIFFGVPRQPDSARAMTVFGVTGLIRSWKWRGAQWSE
ncbi:MAG TPA: type II secretion system protein [Vicinamibacterales bacterium]|nr:type II secretion system protein [Vicinamibacterales bacterium]